MCMHLKCFFFFSHPFCSLLVALFTCSCSPSAGLLLSLPSSASSTCTPSLSCFHQGHSNYSSLAISRSPSLSYASVCPVFWLHSHISPLIYLAALFFLHSFVCFCISLLSFSVFFSLPCTFSILSWFLFSSIFPPLSIFHISLLIPFMCSHFHPLFHSTFFSLSLYPSFTPSLFSPFVLLLSLSISLSLHPSLSPSLSAIGSRVLPQDCSSQRNHILFSTTSSSSSSRHHGDGVSRQRPLPAQPRLSLSFSPFFILPLSLSPCSYFIFFCPSICHMVSPLFSCTASLFHFHLCIITDLLTQFQRRSFHSLPGVFKKYIYFSCLFFPSRPLTVTAISFADVCYVVLQRTSISGQTAPTHTCSLTPQQSFSSDKNPLHHLTYWYHTVCDTADTLAQSSFYIVEVGLAAWVTEAKGQTLW